MSSLLDDLVKSGRQLIVDTKTRKVKTENVKVNNKSVEPPITNPHDAFVKRVIKDKPKIKEIVEDIKRFIAAEEAKL